MRGRSPQGLYIILTPEVADESMEEQTGCTPGAAALTSGLDCEHPYAYPKKVSITAVWYASPQFGSLSQLRP